MGSVCVYWNTCLVFDIGTQNVSSSLEVSYEPTHLSKPNPDDKLITDPWLLVADFFLILLSFYFNFCGLIIPDRRLYGS